MIRKRDREYCGSGREGADVGGDRGASSCVNARSDVVRGLGGRGGAGGRGEEGSVIARWRGRGGRGELGDRSCGREGRGAGLGAEEGAAAVVGSGEEAEEGADTVARRGEGCGARGERRCAERLRIVSRRLQRLRGATRDAWSGTRAWQGAGGGGGRAGRGREGRGRIEAAGGGGAGREWKRRWSAPRSAAAGSLGEGKAPPWRECQREPPQAAPHLGRALSTNGRRRWPSGSSTTKVKPKSMCVGSCSTLSPSFVHAS